MCEMQTYVSKKNRQFSLRRGSKIYKFVSWTGWVRVSLSRPNLPTQISVEIPLSPLLHAMSTEEMFLKVFRNTFCIQDTKYVSATNFARVANGLTFGKLAVYVSNGAMCPCFAGA